MKQGSNEIKSIPLQDTKSALLKVGNQKTGDLFPDDSSSTGKKDKQTKHAATPSAENSIFLWAKNNWKPLTIAGLLATGVGGGSTAWIGRNGQIANNIATKEYQLHVAEDIRNGLLTLKGDAMIVPGQAPVPLESIPYSRNRKLLESTRRTSSLPLSDNTANPQLLAGGGQIRSRRAKRAKPHT